MDCSRGVLDERRLAFKLLLEVIEWHPIRRADIVMLCRNGGGGTGIAVADEEEVKEGILADFVIAHTTQLYEMIFPFYCKSKNRMTAALLGLAN